MGDRYDQYIYQNSYTERVKSEFQHLANLSNYSSTGSSTGNSETGSFD